MNRDTPYRRSPHSEFRSVGVLYVAAVIALCSCAAPSASPIAGDPELEQIYVLRSIREPQAPAIDGCARERTGFEAFPTDADRFFSFWSVRSRAEDGRVVDAQQARVAELRACFGPTGDRARQNFYAQVQLGAMSFHGRGDCLALMTDFPESGLFPVRCQLVLGGLPAPFVGGLLTTNTMTSTAGFGGATEPPGYTQASIATIRLWKSRSTGPQVVQNVLFRETQRE